jgi:hypothetical protein
MMTAAETETLRAELANGIARALRNLAGAKDWLNEGQRLMLGEAARDLAGFLDEGIGERRENCAGAFRN